MTVPKIVEAVVAPDEPSASWLDGLDFEVRFLTAHLRMLEGIAAAVAEVVDAGGDAEDVMASVYDESGYAGCLDRLRLAAFRREFSGLAWDLERDEEAS